MTLTLELNTWDFLLIGLCLSYLLLSAAAELGWATNKYWFLRTSRGTPYMVSAYLFMILENAENAAGERPVFLLGMLLFIALIAAGITIDYRANRDQLRDQSAQLVADLERMYGQERGGRSDQ